MKYDRELKENNRGFTLVEIVCAIAVLAVLIAPVMQSFMTSAVINRRSRIVMAETDVAQTVLEGLTDKTYSEISSILVSAVGTDLTGPYALSTINGGEYNKSGAGVTVASSNTQSLLGVVTQNEINGMAMRELYQPDGAGKGKAKSFINSLRKQFGSDFASSIGDPNSKKMGYWTDNTGTVTMLGYSNIVQGGNKYDVIVTFLPAATNADDIWFSYYVDVAVYKVGPKNSNSVHDFTKPSLTINSGIKNRKNY